MCKAAGDNAHKYKILLVPPTGKAAYNIGGTTIHPALHIPPQQKLEYKELSLDVKNILKAHYIDLEWMLVDEFSIIGNSVFNFMHLHLQEIKGNKFPFDSINIITIGDLYQRCICL